MRVMAATLRLYPFGEMTRLEVPKRVPRNKARCGKLKISWHEWTATLTGWQCALCKGQRPHCAKHLLDMLGCPGLNKAVQLAAVPNIEAAHCLHRVAFSNGQDVVYCSRCGVWGTKRTPQFSRVCARVPPTSAGKIVLSRLNRGMHPRRTANCRSATMLGRPEACA